MLIDTKLEINKDLIVFALKDMSFLRDEAKLETQIKLAQEELESHKAQAGKLTDRMELVGMIIHLHLYIMLCVWKGGCVRGRSNQIKDC